LEEDHKRKKKKVSQTGERFGAELLTIPRGDRGEWGNLISAEKRGSSKKSVEQTAPIGTKKILLVVGWT